MDLKLLLSKLMGEQAFREAQAQALSTGKGYHYPPTISRAGELNPHLQRAEEKDARREELVQEIARQLGPPPAGFHDLYRNMEMRKSAQERREQLLQEALKVGI